MILLFFSFLIPIQTLAQNNNLTLEDLEVTDTTCLDFVATPLKSKEINKLAKSVRKKDRRFEDFLFELSPVANSVALKLHSRFPSLSLSFLVQEANEELSDLLEDLIANQSKLSDLFKDLFDRTWNRLHYEGSPFESALVERAYERNDRIPPNTSRKTFLKRAIESNFLGRMYLRFQDLKVLKFSFLDNNTDKAAAKKLDVKLETYQKRKAKLEAELERIGFFDLVD
ncbi:MAG: hypothetical protein AB7F43_05405 [Bacteriovoracia bacterium]